MCVFVVYEVGVSRLRSYVTPFLMWFRSLDVQSDKDVLVKHGVSFRIVLERGGVRVLPWPRMTV